MATMDRMGNGDVVEVLVMCLHVKEVAYYSVEVWECVVLLTKIVIPCQFFGDAR